MPFISFEVDDSLMAEIWKAVRTVGDTDRSKFIRIAVREQIKRVAPVDAVDLVKPAVVSTGRGQDPVA